MGLINKLRAYQLQGSGLRQLSRGERFGLTPTSGCSGRAATMLEILGFTCIRLLTNTPTRSRGWSATASGSRSVAHAFPANPHNADYLNTKKTKAGHVL